MPTHQTFREVGAARIRDGLQRMLSHADGVHAAEDIEAVHDMRVASRRLRAALSIFADAFPDPEYARLERSVKAVTDALGAARDLDVMLETLAQMDDALPQGERSGLEEFIARRRAERDRRQAGVRRALARLNGQNLVGRFDAIAERCFAAATPGTPETVRSDG